MSATLLNAHQRHHARHPRSARLQILAVAGIWRVRTEDLRARRLRGYGSVHADLAPALDPLVIELRERLGALAQAARLLPED